MSIGTGTLTPREVEIWRLRSIGYKQAEIARKLGIHRQGVNRSLAAIDGKVGQLLNEAAFIHKLDVWGVDLGAGVLEAYSQAFKVPVIVSFTQVNGVQVWYLYEGRCDACNREPQCKARLLAEAEERNVSLSEKDKCECPSTLARKIFSKYSKIVNFD